jgi:two-component system NtrC family sensor kinase
MQDAGLTSMEEIIGKDDFQLSWKKTALFYRAGDKKVMENNITQVGYEEPQDKPDGSQMWLRTSKTPLHDRTGHVIGILGTYEDITEQKLAAEIMQESEERFRLAFENTNTGMCLVDLKGNLARVNNKMCEIFGYTKEELEHMTVNDIAHPDDIGKSPEFIQKSLQGKIGSSIFEKRYFHKKGDVLTCEVSSSLIRNTAGAPLYFISHIHDVTERKRIEEALRQSEEKYRNILENIQEGYFELDLAGNFTFVNDAECRNLGYPKEELIGRNNRQYQDEATIRRMYQIFNNMYKTGEPIKVIDIEIIRKDGTKKFNEISVSLIRDSKGKKIGFSGVSRDITERKRAEDALKKNREELIKKNQELEESRKNVQLTLERLGAAYEELKTTQAKILQQEKMASIGQLAAGVAHEINNPMAFIASNLGTLDKYIRRLKDFIRTQSEAIKSLKATDAIEKLEKKRKELKLDYTLDDIDFLVKESRDGSERVQKIVQELNRFSRVDDAEYKDTNINECMESSINIVWNELQHKATLHKDYGNLPSTKCYPQKLNQVFINLLINAIQAIEKKGKIKIKTWEKDGSIWVTVSDTGCGIPRENQSKIFEPFFTTKEVGKGTGLGLSISYEIMQRHKGEISFESKEGKGTAFTIRMPVV